MRKNIGNYTYNFEPEMYKFYNNNALGLYEDKKMG